MITDFDLAAKTFASRSLARQSRSVWPFRFGHVRVDAAPRAFAWKYTTGRGRGHA